MKSSQDDVFTVSEADNWFERNRGALDRFDPEKDLPLRVMTLYGLKPGNVLEVGSSNGFRLAEIRRRFGAMVTGVDPSAAAIDDGHRRFPDIQFVCGTASSIAVEGLFDLVIVNFVLHWVDRSLLLRSVAEIDRLLKDGGCLILGDFLPDDQAKVKYQHLPDNEVYTYKQNYASLFLASGLYQQVCSLSGRCGTKKLEPDVESEKRIGVTVLRKTLEGRYQEQVLQS